MAVNGLITVSPHLSPNTPPPSGGVTIFLRHACPPPPFSPCSSALGPLTCSWGPLLLCYAGTALGQAHMCHGSLQTVAAIFFFFFFFWGTLFLRKLYFKNFRNLCHYLWWVGRVSCCCFLRIFHSHSLKRKMLILGGNI